MLRHTVEHIVDLVRVAPMVQILDAPVPQTVEQLPDILRFFNTLMLSNMAVDSAPGAAMRRRQRRLRQFLRHERLTVAMALAEATHHAAPRRQKPASATVYDAPRGQKNADAEYFELSSDEEVASARGVAAGSALGAAAAGQGGAAPRRAHR